MALESLNELAGVAVAVALPVFVGVVSVNVRIARLTEQVRGLHEWVGREVQRTDKDIEGIRGLVDRRARL